MANGPNKNFDRVLEGWADFRVECGIQTHKIKEALKIKRYDRALHHATGYLEAGIQNLSKLWLYTWVPKWSLVAYLIFVGV